MSYQPREEMAFICRIDGVHKLDGRLKCRYCGISNTEAGLAYEPYMYTGEKETHLHGKVFGART